MKYFVTLICLFLLAGKSLAQVNLVPNGGFEDFDTCPTAGGQIDRCANWFNSGENCSPDYYHACGEGSQQQIPDVDCGYYPFEGDGAARIGLYDGGGEPLSVHLLDTLEQNAIYQFSVQLRRHCFGGACGSIGVLFTDTAPQIAGNCDSITFSPQLQRNPTEIILGTDWVMYTDTLIATGGETYLTITNFLSESLFILVDEPSFFPAALYWVDDVSLVRIGAVGLTEPLHEIQIKLTSELVSDQLEITTDKPVQLHLMDISGRMVLSKQLNSGRNSINVFSIPSGMYVAVFTSENGQTTSKKIVKVN